MADIIKTWPASFSSRHVLEVFTHPWADFYFSVGRGKPQQKVEKLWYTHRGRILGSFNIRQLVQNDGTLPKLESITGEVSEWQFKPDIWVAICDGPIERLEEKLYFSGFRGWRYFNLDEYRDSFEAKVWL